MENLKYIHFNLNSQLKNNYERELLNKIYNCFKVTWIEGNRLVHESDYFSDGFLFNDSIECLMYYNRPIALTFHRALNFNDEMFLDQKFVKKYWPEYLVNELKNYKNISYCNHFSVHPEFTRRNFKEFDVGEFISTLTVLSLLDSKADLMLGMMNLHKKMDRISEISGAIIHDQKVKLGGIEVDLVSYTKTSISNALKHFNKDIIELYKKGEFYGDYRISKLFYGENETIRENSINSQLAG